MKEETSERTIRLSPGKLICDALSVTWEYRKPLATALLVPLAMIMLLDLLQMPFETKKASKSSAVFMVLELLKLFPFTILAISLHRIILRGPESVPKFGILKWTKRETRFFTPSVLDEVGEGTGGPATHILVCLVFLPAAYVFARIVLVLPATALDLRPTLSSASSLSKGNGWRLVLLLLVLPGSVSFLFSALLGSLLSARESSVLTILKTLLSYAFFALGVAILSTAYRHLLIVKSPGLSELVFGAKSTECDREAVGVRP